MSRASTCAHASFRADVRVGRLTKTDEGPVTAYTADVRITCHDCGLPFRFLGLSAGSSPDRPTVSVDALELRAPLEPAHVPEILGHPLVSGRA